MVKNEITPVRQAIILTFADSGMRLAETGRRLFLDKSSVQYHLKVVKQITGLDPRNADDLGKLVEMVKELKERSNLTNVDYQVILELANNNMNIAGTARAMSTSSYIIACYINKIKNMTGLDAKNFYDLIKLVEMVNGGAEDGK